MSWPAAVLFDFDGVIVNSEPLHFYAFYEALRQEKIDLTEGEYFQELIGFDDKGAFYHIYAKRGLSLEPKVFLRLMAHKGEILMDLIDRKQYHALSGVEELVRGLWRHYPLAICSGARREEIEAMLEGVRLRDCFPTIIAAEDVQVGKPDPSGYQLTMKLVSDRIKKLLKPADCLIIEDAPAVCKTVRKVGFPVLAVATSYPIEFLTDANWQVRSLESKVVKAKLPQLKLEI